jgi:hypothetical protein
MYPQQHSGAASGGSSGDDDEARGPAGGGTAASSAAAAGPPRPSSRPAKPAARAARAPASARPRPCPRANDPARELAALEARAEEARELVRALEGRNQGLRASARDLADELASLRVLRMINVGGGGAGHSGGGGGGGVGGGQGGSRSVSGGGAAPAAPAAASDASPASTTRAPLALSEAIERAYSRQVEGLTSDGGELAGRGGRAVGVGARAASWPSGPTAAAAAAPPPPPPSSRDGDDKLFECLVVGHANDATSSGGGAAAAPDVGAAASALFRASALGLFGPCPASASAALARRVAERFAQKPLGWAPGGGDQPRARSPLEAAIALYRSHAARAALVLRRARVVAFELGGGGGGDGRNNNNDNNNDDNNDTNNAAAAVEAEAASLASEVLIVVSMMLTRYPEVLDELLRHRIDDERSPPAPHADRALERQQARAAMRAAGFSAEQREALRSARKTYRRNMDASARAWRECARDMAGQRGDGAALSEQLIARFERAVAACSLHRALLASRLLSLVTPLQLAGLVADSFPFVVRSALLISGALDDDDDGGGGGCEDEGDDGGGAGDGGSRDAPPPKAA